MRRQTPVRNWLALGAAILGAMVTGPAAQAHHSFAMFDAQKELILSGAVTQFQWTNPHTWIEMDVYDDKGVSSHWSIEGGSPLGLSRQGWRRDIIKAGDKITLVIHPLKDGTAGGSLMGVTLADGKHLGATLAPTANP